MVMEECLIDDCQKKEWQRLRKLRLIQVRDQSKHIAQEVRQRTKEKKEKGINALNNKRDRVLQEWKKTKIQELEEKYYAAMEKVGLSQAQAEPDPALAAEKAAKDKDMALKRGKVALLKQKNHIQLAMEKENAPIRRKDMIRNIEDIRAGLVVQCRDWGVINQAGRQVLLDIPVANIDDFQPHEPKKTLPLSDRSTNILKPSLSPKRNKLKSPKPKSPRIESSRPYPSPKQPTIAPKLVTDLEGVKCAEGSSTVCPSPTPNLQEPLVEFYNHRARNDNNYRLERRAVQQSYARSTPHESTIQMPCHRSTATFSAVVPSINQCNLASDDEELDILRRKYAPSPCASQVHENLSYSSEPAETTLPTREYEDSIRRTSYRKARQQPILKSKKSNRNETKKLFKAIDKALEEGRRLKEEVSKDDSNCGSVDSESDTEAVVKLVVNVNCGQLSGPEIEKCVDEKMSPKLTISEEKGCQVEKEEVETCNVGTETGTSLIDTYETFTKTEDTGQPKKRRGRKMRRSCCCKQVAPMQRTSTVADLSGEGQPEKIPDVSSIHDETFDNVSLQNEPTLDSVAQPSAQKSLSKWSSTAYLEPPSQTTSPMESFELNPFLDYYIRKLLGMAPMPCEISECTECRCKNGNSTATMSWPSTHRDVTSQRSHRSPVVTEDQSPLINTDKSRVMYQPMSTNWARERTGIKSSTNRGKVDSMKSVEQKSDKLEACSDYPIITVSPTNDSPFHERINKVANYEAESERRLNRIAELKGILEQIRTDGENFQFSSSSRGSSAISERSESRRHTKSNKTATSSNRDSSSSGSRSSDDSRTLMEETKMGQQAQQFSTLPSERGIPPPALEDHFKRLGLPDFNEAHQLSTIMEVDSRLHISDLPSNSSTLANDMDILLRRELISAPFNWSEGASLSDMDSDSSMKDRHQEVEGPSLRITPGKADFKNNLDVSLKTPSSYHPHDTHLEDDWFSIDQSNRPQIPADQSGSTDFMTLQRNVSDNILESPEDDIDKIISQLDLTWAKRF